MRVTARQVDISKCPPNVRRYLGQSFVTRGKTYVVYALALFENILLAQIVDDQGYPSWRPFWLFDVADTSLPRDWICSVFHDDPTLLLGPPFIAEDQTAYSAMVELDQTQVGRFWTYVDAVKARGAEE